MAARPSWEGHLRLSLVTCPVSLWSATTTAETLRFNLINPKTNNRIRMKTVDAGTGEELSRGDLVKGFAVIREAMKRKGMVAIGRLVMSTRERVCAIEIEEDGLVLTTLRTAEEVRTLDEIGHPDLPRPDAQMLEIAEKIVAQQSGRFDPSDFTDRYEDALRALIEEKKKGKPVKSKPVREEADSGVVDLMAALKKSLQGDGPGRERAERFTAAARANRKKPSPRGRKAA
ncbi:Ku protein [Reyranella sp.]|uniref:Ku protein n=1 Tax=Reyranella sp. TaxID=1929291 RepID=UPI0027212EAC|nr:Ku protein [Reyranella sp.]MDO8976249.1 Ku protein [Reyranella sp.]